MKVEETADAEWMTVFTDASSKRALMEFSRSLHPIVGDTPSKAELKKWMGFVIEVWNTVLTMQIEQDHTVARPLIRKIESMSEPQRSTYSDLFLELTGRKLREFAKAGWFYRDVHVYSGPHGELRIRAEALTWADWQKLGVRS